MKSASVIIVLCTMLLEQSTLAKDTVWWKNIRNQIEFPCSANSPQTRQQTGVPETEQLMSLTGDGTRTRQNRNRDCLPLNKSSFIAPTKEGLDIATQLLKMKRVRRWVRGPLSEIAKKVRCDIKICVCLPLQNKTDLTKAERKTSVDLVQLASYGWYLEQAVTTISQKRKADRTVRDVMQALSTKLKNIACSLRPAIAKPLLSHVTADHVPADLRHKKRKAGGRVATYVILEKIEQFLRELPGTYRRNGVKICKYRP